MFPPVDRLVGAWLMLIMLPILLLVMVGLLALVAGLIAAGLWLASRRERGG